MSSCILGFWSLCPPFFLLRQGALLGLQSPQRRWIPTLVVPQPGVSVSPYTHRFSNGLSYCALPSAWNSILPSPTATPQCWTTSPARRNWAELLQRAELGRATRKLRAGGHLDFNSAVTTPQLTRAPWLGTGSGDDYKFDSTRSSLKFYFTKQNKLKMH